jgi:hypothetical protein
MAEEKIRDYDVHDGKHSTNLIRSYILREYHSDLILPFHIGYLNFVTFSKDFLSTIVSQSANGT